ncbi:MAG: hypothetical protein KDB82_06020 [Planctomycetes bacterium]|nr:hypothetical protein [Planctomycetota bacterium]
MRRVTKRPCSTQEAWDRHLVKRRRGSTLWRIFKIAVIPVVVVALLALAAAPLSFG